MMIRYQADNDLDQRIIDALIRLVPETQFKKAPEAGIHFGIPDLEVLRIAAEDNRILVTHDLKTMPLYFGGFIEQNISPGVILIRQEVAIREAAIRLQFFQEAGTPEDSSIRLGSSANLFDDETQPP